MKAQLANIILFAIFIIPVSCKKNDISTPPITGSHTGTITGKGTAIGNAAFKSITTEGGSISSTDGKISVTIPKDAINSTISFSIQPVTNKTPNGIGLAYRLLPEGLHFNKPVTITFHYTDSLIAGTTPELLHIAYQDSTGVWQSIDNVSLHTDTKSISVSSLHFSDWSAFSSYILIPQHKDISPGDLDILTVKEVDFPDLNSSEVPIDTTVTEKKVVNWDLIYKEGTLTPFSTGPSATYIAPDQVPSHNPVEVTAEIHNIQSNQGPRGVVILYATINITNQFMEINLEGNIKTYPVCRLYAAGTSTVIQGGPDKDTLAAIITFAGKGSNLYQFNTSDNNVVTTDAGKAYTSFYAECNAGLVSTPGAINVIGWGEPQHYIDGEVNGTVATGFRCNYQMKNVKIRFSALRIN